MIIYHKISTVGYKTGTTSVTTGRSYNYLDYPAVADHTKSICSKSYNSDRELASMLNMEKWNMYGVKIIFYEVSYDTTKDNVWGEDNDRSVISAHNVMSYFELPKENKTWSKFGIEGINNFSMFISKEHFRSMTNNYIPRVGDLVLTSYNNKLYEISEVKEETPTFLLSKQYAWELIVREAKIENSISVSTVLSASPIAEFYSVDDIMDIRNDVDIKKEEIIYKTEQSERPTNDPFGKW